GAVQRRAQGREAGRYGRHGAGARRALRGLLRLHPRGRAQAVGATARAPGRRVRTRDGSAVDGGGQWVFANEMPFSTSAMALLTRRIALPRCPPLSLAASVSSLRAALR